MPTDRLRLETVKRYGMNGRKACRMARSLVYIYSAEHYAYWRPGGHGYTTLVEMAGSWSLAAAHRMTSHCCPRKKIVFVSVDDAG